MSKCQGDIARGLETTRAAQHQNRIPDGPSTRLPLVHTDVIFEQDIGEDSETFGPFELGDLGVQMFGHGLPLVMHLYVKTTITSFISLAYSSAVSLKCFLRVR